MTKTAEKFVVHQIKSPDNLRVGDVVEIKYYNSLAWVSMRFTISQITFHGINRYFYATGNGHARILFSHGLHGFTAEGHHVETIVRIENTANTPETLAGFDEL
ncbi:hypothetical protein SEA_BEE17_3 [Microbacterium phage Bee17]|nr:hypothetical protein SEA_BEE17_3 [Microbacterium phage Bee17]